MVSRAGEVSAVGWFGTKSGSRAMIRRYDSGGRFMWQATYTAEGGGSAQFVAAALLPRGRVVATGTLVNAKTGNSNIVTVGFAAKGPSLWQQIWDTPHPPSGVSHDWPTDVVVDAAGRGVRLCGVAASGARRAPTSPSCAYTAERRADQKRRRAPGTAAHGDDFAPGSDAPAAGRRGRDGAVAGCSRGRFQMATVELPY